MNLLKVSSAARRGPATTGSAALPALGGDGSGARNRDLRLLRVTPANWPQIQEWAAEEYFNMGRGDDAIVAHTDPDAFFAGFIGERHASAVSVVNWDENFAFAGMLLVDPALRGIGLGWDTFNAAIGHAGDRAVAVDAPMKLEDCLQQLGFVTAWRIIRWAGRIPPARKADPHVVPVVEEHHGQLAAWDAACFPADRPGFATGFATAPERRALVYSDATGRIRGYGVLRAVGGAMRIGPLYAQESYHAAAIFDGLCDLARQADAVTVTVDVPEPNVAACAVAETRGLSYDSDAVRMSRSGAAGPPRKIDLTRLYGLSLLGLG
ncbi:GNAT superfamily N-acetyltransferase [Catenulispora sp. GAS73]|uniref:GNAT family N-acetyltransferase n=1 Tax=Catenulispora sp. GAS73 TaxID=3156269 RepID=UPI003515491B